MKYLALAAALTLQLSGLWPHVSNHARSELASVVARASQPAPSPAPVAAIPSRLGTEPLSLEAGTSAYAIDATTSLPLFAQNAAKERPIASVTKLVTAITILSRHKLDETVTIGKLPQYQSDDDTLGFITGEKYKLSDLIKAALIPSANDAADALAIYDAGSTQKFATTMNTKMQQWGITGAHFSSPSGLQDDNNYASAENLAKIAKLALQNPFIKQTVMEQSATFSSLSGRPFAVTTTDDLLATGQFYGIKTGYTGQAGQCFVGLTKIDGHEVITVVLGSSDRFAETQTLVNWIGRNWQWL